MPALTKDEVRQVVEDTQKNMAKQIAELHEAYYGNGKPGIKTEIALLKNRMVLLYSVGGALAIAVLGIIAKLIVSHIG